MLYYVTQNMFFDPSGNYGGALGASALAKGLEGNKALRVLILSPCNFFLRNVICLL